MYDAESCIVRASPIDPVALSLLTLSIVVTICIVTSEALGTFPCWPKWARPFVKEPAPSPSLANVETRRCHSHSTNAILFLLVGGLTVCATTRLYFCWNVASALSTAPWVLEPFAC